MAEDINEIEGFDIPELNIPGVDEARIRFLAQRLSAPERRKLRGAVKRGLQLAEGSTDPLSRSFIIRNALREFSGGQERVIGASERAARGQEREERGTETQARMSEFQARVQANQAAFQAEQQRRRQEERFEQLKGFTAFEKGLETGQIDPTTGEPVTATRGAFPRVGVTAPTAPGRGPKLLTAKATGPTDIFGKPISLIPGQSQFTSAQLFPDRKVAV
jgi:hypothetical protein